MTNNLKKRFTTEQVEALNKKFENSSAQEILEWATYLHPRIALATSFQAQGVVLIDMFVKINKKARIFTLDTGRLNEETYEVMDAIRSKYGATIEVLFPDKSEVEEMVGTHGPNLFYKGKYNTISFHSSCSVQVASNNISSIACRIEMRSEAMPLGLSLSF